MLVVKVSVADGCVWGMDEMDYQHIKPSTRDTATGTSKIMA